MLHRSVGLRATATCLTAETDMQVAGELCASRNRRKKGFGEDNAWREESGATRPNVDKSVCVSPVNWLLRIGLGGD